MVNNILTVTVNPSLDVLVTSKKKIISAGGKGNNVARALKSLNARVHALSTIGGQNGKKLKSLFLREKIPATWVALKGETRRNVTKGFKHHVQLSEKVSVNEIKSIEHSIITLSKQKRGIVFSGSLLYGMKDTFYLDLIRKLKKENQKLFVAVDTRPEILLKTLKCRPDIIKPNRQEAEEALNFRITNQKKIKEAVMAFCALGAKIVLLTLGSKGAVVGNQKNIYFVKAPDVDVVRTVGCGDAFLGGFIFGFQNQLDIRACAVLGCAAATASCTQLIPGRIPINKFNVLVHQIKIKQL